MQNKANFKRFSPENDDFTKKQTQFKANKAKNKPNLSQNKPNSNPIRLPGKPLSLRIFWIDFKSGKRYNIVHKSNIWGAKTTGK
jgi:hypothetical protein